MAVSGLSGMGDNSNSQDIEDLLEIFLADVRAGGSRDVAEFADQHPQHADDLRELLPTLLAIEDLAPHSESEAAASNVSELPSLTVETLGDYRVIREIGRGGMGVVYEAEQMTLGRRVALKVLPRGTLDDRFVERFRREARAAAKLHHTNIVPIYDVGEEGNMLFYAMQHIRGAGLDQVIEELRRLRKRSPDSTDVGGADDHRRQPDSLATRGRDSNPRADDDNVRGVDSGEIDVPADDSSGYNAQSAVSSLLSRDASPIDCGSGVAHSANSNTRTEYSRHVAKIGVQIAEALDYAHRQGVLHRDIKPANLLLDMSGVAWITDFGLAKSDADVNLTQSGDVIGTIRYMPPESFHNETDVRSEVYALGITLYEMLALRPAFEGANRFRLIHSVNNSSPPTLRSLDRLIPADLETIVEKACDREPGTRYQSAAELAADLRRFLNDEPIQARRVSQLERVARWTKRNTGLAVSLAAITLLLITGFISAVVAAVHFQDKERIQRQLAESNGRLAIEKTELARTAAVLANEKAEEAERANQNEAKARQSATEAALARDSERKQRLIAEENERKTKQILFFSRMFLAGESVTVPNGIQNIQQTVDAWRPETATFDWRGWEWHFLLSHVNRAEVVAVEKLCPVYWLAWSADGARIATSGDGRKVRIWNAHTGQMQQAFGGHELSVGCVEWSPDNLQIVSTGGTKALVRDVVSGQQMLEIQPDNGVLGCVAWSSDGSRIATTTRSRIEIWQAETGDHLGVIPVGEREIRSLDWHPNGKKIVAPNGNSTFSVWNVDNAEIERTFVGHARGVRSVCWSPDGQRLASSSHDDTVRVWDADSGDELGAFTLPHAARTVRWSPNSQQLVAASDDGSVQLLHLSRNKQTGQRKPAQQFLGHSNFSTHAAFSPDGTRMASTSADTTLRIWDVAKGTTSILCADHFGDVNCVHWTADGKRLLTGSGDSTLRVWDGVSGQPLHSFGHHKAHIDCAVWNPDATRIASGARDGSVSITDATSGESEFSIQHDTRAVSAVCWTADGRGIISGHEDGTIRWSDSHNGRQLAKLSGHTDVVLGLAISPNGTQLASCGGDRTVRVWDLHSKALVWAARCAQQRINAVTWSPDGKQIAAVSTDAHLRILDARNGTVTTDLTGHDGSIFSVAWHPDGSRIATGGNDRAIKLWDVETGEMVLALRGHTATIRGVGFSSDGMKIASASRDFTVRIWDASVGYRLEHDRQSISAGKSAQR